MNDRTDEAAERRARTREFIDRLLAQRQQMFVLYERVAGIEPYSDEAPSEGVVHDFASVLVDYIAAGEFALYDRIAAGNERRQAVLDLADEVYPEIARTTEQALAFNDSLGRRGAGLNYAQMKRLSELGEALATRIELEDRLLEQLLR